LYSFVTINSSFKKLSSTKYLKYKYIEYWYTNVGININTLNTGVQM